MSERYPHECCRCGFCCLAETCPAGMSKHGIGRFDRCPSLKFSVDGVAECLLAGSGLVPIGDGCYIKASAYKAGVGYDFASLPSWLKKEAAHRVRGRVLQ